MKREITNVYFSPSGTTAAIAKQVASNLSESAQEIDLLASELKSEIQFAADDVLVAAMPVFAGRIPSVCVDSLKNLKGNNTHVIAIVVYGNRAYEDALLELVDILEDGGFNIAGAGALIARHSIFPRVAQDRPDSTDIERIAEFSNNCMTAIESNKYSSITVPGDRPYREGGLIPMSVSASSRCNGCKACAQICPAGAIDCQSPKQTDNSRCINCTACIYACPQKARKYRGLKYWLGSKAFAKRCSDYLEPEFFLSQSDTAGSRTKKNNP